MVSFPTVYKRVIAHWRAIILLLILAVATVPIAYGDFLDLITLALFLLFIASQVFWIGRILDLGERFISLLPARFSGLAVSSTSGSGSSPVSPAAPGSRSWRAWSIRLSSCTASPSGVLVT